MVKGTSDHRPDQRSVICVPFWASSMNTWSPTAERHLAAQDRGVLSNFQVTECNMTWNRIAHLSNSPTLLKGSVQWWRRIGKLSGRSRGTPCPRSGAKQPRDHLRAQGARRTDRGRPSRLDPDRGSIAQIGLGRLALGRGRRCIDAIDGLNRPVDGGPQLCDFSAGSRPGVGFARARACC